MQTYYIGIGTRRRCIVIRVTMFLKYIIYIDTKSIRGAAGDNVIVQLNLVLTPIIIILLKYTINVRLSLSVVC